MLSLIGLKTLQEWLKTLQVVNLFPGYKTMKDSCGNELVEIIMSLA